VNGCHSRLLTAESDTLYTTFEDILSRFFPQNGDKDNAFLSYVGEFNIPNFMILHLKNYIFIIHKGLVLLSFFLIF